MNSDLSSNSSRRWDRLADTYASTVWSVIQEAGLPHHVGSKVNRLTWLRLADHLAKVDPATIEAWLCDMARREVARSARLVNVAPQAGIA